MKAATVRKLAQSWSAAQLDAAAESILELEQDVPEIESSLRPGLISCASHEINIYDHMLG